MSKGDDRRAAQAAFEADQDNASNARPNEPPVPASAAPRAWLSYCAGWRLGFHERAREENGLWRCRWCFQLLTPPTEADVQEMKRRASAALTRQRHPLRKGRFGRG